MNCVHCHVRAVEVPSVSLCMVCWVQLPSNLREDVERFETVTVGTAEVTEERAVAFQDARSAALAFLDAL